MKLFSGSATFPLEGSWSPVDLTDEKAGKNQGAGTSPIPAGVGVTEDVVLFKHFCLLTVVLFFFYFTKLP